MDMLEYLAQIRARSSESLGQPSRLSCCKAGTNEVDTSQTSGWARFWNSLKAFQNRVAVALTVVLLFMLYFTGLWQESSGLTRDNEKSYGNSPAYRTVQVREHGVQADADLHNRNRADPLRQAQWTTDGGQPDFRWSRVARRAR